MRLVEGVDLPINPLPKDGVFSEGNMENISTTIPINISAKPNVVEKVHIGANFSSEEVALTLPYLRNFTMSFPGHMRR